MKNDNQKNEFDWALYLIQQQYERDPYSMTSDQLKVLDVNDKILKEIKSNQVSKWANRIFFYFVAYNCLIQPILRLNMNSACGNCKHANIEIDRHREMHIECRRFPPTVFNSGSLAKFPKILPEWKCGEYQVGEQDYWEIAKTLWLLVSEYRKILRNR